VKETKNYIENLVRDISSVQKLDYCKHPFALFLYTKIVAANANEIEVVMDFDSAIFSSIKIPSIHLVDVIGNLLDNAIEASNELPKEERLIEIQIQKKYESIVFVISNNGSVEDYMEKIFLTGFSTKEKGKGLGLPIARDTVAMLDGKLELTSYSPVVLEVTLPNKKSS
jgi:sensor histidine kinase regulating citrate/malate metabolism